MGRLTLFILLAIPGLSLAGVIIPPPVQVPEPSSMALFAGGAVAAGLIRYIKK